MISETKNYGRLQYGLPSRKLKYLQNRKRSPRVYYIPLQRGKIALKHTAKAKKSEKNVVSYRGRRGETVLRGETVTPGHP